MAIDGRDEIAGNEAAAHGETWRIGLEAAVPADHTERVGQALDVLIDGELKLLGIYDARQASADARTTALATAAIGLPTLILSLSKSFASSAVLPKVGYVVIILVAFVVVGARSWNAWRRRRSDPKHPGPLISAEAAGVATAREAWYAYQRVTALPDSDPIRAKQLALEMWRARAVDSRRVAQIKDILSVAAAIAFGIALGVSAYLVGHARLS